MKNGLIIFFVLTFTVLTHQCSHELTPGQIAKGPQDLDKNALISGTVSIKEGLMFKGTGTLYIIAHKKDAPFGRPLAVKKIDDPVLPIGFQMSQANVMVAGDRFAGALVLTAKFSHAGNAMELSAGDLSTTFPLDVLVGQQGVKLVLDKKE